MFNYAITQAALLMTVFAVMYRTGTADLNKLGGLFTRMPLSFVVLLIGIISLQARAGRDAKRVIVTARKEAKGPMRLCAPFTIHAGRRHESDADDFTKEAEAVLREAEVEIATWRAQREEFGYLLCVAVPVGE